MPESSINPVSKEEAQSVWNQFVELFRILQNSHGVEVDLGCSCCHTGHVVKGYKFYDGDQGVEDGFLSLRGS